uniref:Uncharacterized protein n=1 Tax=Octopus bimaculoides TaxID=37653 RepID=A0A0L8HIQ8_OCTBM
MLDVSGSISGLSCWKQITKREDNKRKSRKIKSGIPQPNIEQDCLSMALKCCLLHAIK